MFSANEIIHGPIKPSDNEEFVDVAVLGGEVNLFLQAKGSPNTEAMINRSLDRKRRVSLNQLVGGLSQLGGALSTALRTPVQELRLPSGESIQVDFSDKPILGRITFAPLEIKINSRDKTAPITRFTLAHELGHYYLNHGRYIARESLRSKDIDQLERIAVPKSELERLEWQANTFASYLLMPERDFLEAFSLVVAHHDIRNRGHGALFLDHQRDNIRNYHLVLDGLSRYFAVSKSAAAIRLRGLGVLVEA